MFRSLTKVLPFIFLAALTSLTACRKREGLGIVGPVLTVESEQALQERSKEFDAWIRSRGFSPCASPSGTTEWSGGHTQGDQPKWYRLRESRYDRLLRVTLNARDREIRTDIDYAGRLYPGESKEAKARTRETYKDILLWFMTRAKPTHGNDSDAKQIQDSYRHNFEWIDSHPDL